jgi:hypothetical protein
MSKYTMGFFVVNKFFVPKGFSGITLYPFVFTTDESYIGNERFCNHERIHLAQQRELLILPFYIWYLIDFLIKYFKYKDKLKAYKNIIFEREAYSNDGDYSYLKQRKWYSFLRYI